MEFVRVSRCGQAAAGDGWKMSYLHTRRTAARIGINLSKRMVRHATRRNRLRRVLRERFRQLWQPALPPVDIVLQPTVPPVDENNAVAACAKLLAGISSQPPGNKPANKTNTIKAQ